MRTWPLVLIAVGVVGAVLLYRANRSAAPEELTPDGLSIAPEPLWTDSMKSWIDNLTQDASANEKRWHATIVAAEQAQGLPAGLLSRLLYQESRYRSDIITGATKSSVGALGIAQFMPATARDLHIDPIDPAQAIPAAARYLAALYASTGDWKLALASYNFGLTRVKRGDSWPAETVAYVNEISNDVGLA